MHLDPIMPVFVAVITFMILLAMAARAIKQPQIVGYLLAGIALGPSGFALIEDAAVLSRLGSIGVIFLLFFIGLEVSPRRLGSNWRVAVIGTLLQVGATTGVVIVLGLGLDWPIQRSILIGFVLSLSSTAVVLKLLQERRELNTTAGQDVLGMLLIQDLAVIPMLIIIGFFDGKGLGGQTLALQLTGASVLIGLTVWIANKEKIALPLGRWIRRDRELQVLAAMLICFGLSLLSGLLQLSTALGAFIAGMIVHATREMKWVEDSLHGFRVIFVALFFVSVGMLVDLSFLQEHWKSVVLLVLVAVVVNNAINTVILRGLGRSWAQSLYAGALLAQIGEFSFILAAVGIQANLISGFGYQMTISVIGISLLISPAWIAVAKWGLRAVRPGHDPSE